MSKIIKINEDFVWIGTNDNKVIKLVNEGDFGGFAVGDEVEVFEGGGEILVSKVKNTPKKTETKVDSGTNNGINININNANNNNSNNAGSYGYNGDAREKVLVNKATFILLALFLGFVGGQRFYCKDTGVGVLSIIFCFTFIPSIIALIDIFRAIATPADRNGNILI